MTVFVVVLVMVVAATTVFMMLVMVVAATAVFMMLMMVVTATATLMMFVMVVVVVMMVSVISAGMDFGVMLHTAGDGGESFQKRIGILCGDA